LPKAFCVRQDHDGRGAEAASAAFAVLTACRRGNDEATIKRFENNNATIAVFAVTSPPAI